MQLHVQCTLKKIHSKICSVQARHLSSLIVLFLVVFVWFMVFNATINNISVLLWQSVILVVETGVPAENERPFTNHWQTLSHNVVSSTPCQPWTRFEITTLVVIGTVYTGSCKSIYHTIYCYMCKYIVQIKYEFFE